jgi:hypothetical protein
MCCPVQIQAWLQKWLKFKQMNYLATLCLFYEPEGISPDFPPLDHRHYCEGRTEILTFLICKSGQSYTCLHWVVRRTLNEVNHVQVQPLPQTPYTIQSRVFSGTLRPLTLRGSQLLLQGSGPLPLLPFLLPWTRNQAFPRLPTAFSAEDHLRG